MQLICHTSLQGEHPVREYAYEKYCRKLYSANLYHKRRTLRLQQRLEREKKPEFHYEFEDDKTRGEADE